MAALNDEVKLFIVHALACFDRPTQVSEAVKEEFGLDVPRQQVVLYDPTKPSGKHLSKKYKAAFEDARKRFRSEQSEIPIAQRAFRLRTLERLATKAERIRNLALTLQILEQAAKEVGDVYVNKNRADPADAQPPTPVSITFGVVDARKRTDDGD